MVIKGLTNILTVISQVFGVIMFIVSLVEIDPDSEKGETKKEKAKEWIRDVGKRLVDEGKLPEWAYDMFFDSVLVDWAIDILVKLSNRLGFFSGGG